MTWTTLHRLDGREIAGTCFEDFLEKWPQITRWIRDETGCEYEDIQIEEAEEGDYITVQGQRYAYTREVT